MLLSKFKIHNLELEVFPSSFILILETSNNGAVELIKESVESIWILHKETQNSRVYFPYFVMSST